MKSFDAHIEYMLLRCGSDSWLCPFAEQLLDRYSAALQLSVTGGYTAHEMERMGKTAREQLRTGLCDLVNAAQRATGSTIGTPSPATNPTQQTTPSG